MSNSPAPITASDARPSVAQRLFGPVLHTARHYTRRKFARDLVAGLTVSVVELPQAMAYALVAGVPPQYGIYSSVIQGILGALLSSSEHLTTGPTNTQSLLIASAVMPLVDPAAWPDVYLQIVFLLTLMKGLFQLGFFAFKVGDLVQFVSRAVIVGIGAGAGVLILIGQFPALLGVQVTTRSDLPGAIGVIARLLPHVRDINPTAALIGAGVAVVMVGMRRVGRFVPGALLGVVGSAGLVYFFSSSVHVPTIGELPHTWPTFNIPSTGGLPLHVIYTLIPGALALAMLGGIESVAIAKTMAAKSGERIDANQELFAQGFKNALTSFFQCIPGSASFTRSALDYDAGAATRFAAVMNALFVGMMFFLFANVAQYVPTAALAGVLCVIAVGLVDVAYFKRLLKADRSDAMVLLVTFLAVVLTRLEYAIFIGIFVNIAFYLRTSSRLHVAEMVQNNSGSFEERPVYGREGERQIVFLQLEGDLFFAVADQLQDQLSRLRTAGVRVVILRLKRCHSIDSTVLDVLERFTLDIQSDGGQLILCGVRPEVMATLHGYNLDALIGAANLFAASTGPFTSARQALERAKTLVSHSVDVSSLKVGDEDWSYDI